MNYLRSFTVKSIDFTRGLLWGRASHFIGELLLHYILQHIKLNTVQIDDVA